jgi:malonyl-CoA/methylmalonyl-CoA synthetase
VTLLSILSSNAIAMPLSSAFPSSELRYILDNSQAAMLVASPKYTEQAKTVLSQGPEKTPLFAAVEKRMGGSTTAGSIIFEDSGHDQAGLMLYTSGTTSRPKGVLLPNSVLTAQAQSLIEAWKYSPKDYLLHVLPLHHIHGTVNALLTPLTAGSTIEFMFPFNAKALLERLATPFTEPAFAPPPASITFLTVVPTIYNRLLSAFPDLPEVIQVAAKKAISPENLRINISGSAALPTPTKQAWSDLSHGNILLERYCMTEV